MEDKTKVTCSICKIDEAVSGGKKCTNCWEVMKRLKDFIKGKHGRKFVEEVLSETND